MAETRHRTVLEIGVDDRQVRGLGGTMERAFSPDMIEQFDRSLERVVRTMGRLVEQQVRLGQVLDRMDQQARRRGAGGGPGGAGGGPGPGGGRAGVGIGGVAVGTFAGQMLANWANRASAVGGAALTGGGFVQNMFGSLPYFGSLLGGAVQGIMQMYQSFVAQQMAGARGFGPTGVGAGMAGFRGQAARFGIMPAEAPGVLGGFAGPSGLRGKELLEAVGGRGGLLEWQQLFGFQNLAGVIGAARAAGGEPDTSVLIPQAVAAGRAMGFRGGELDEFFGQFDAWIRETRTKGILIDTGSAAQFVQGVARLGGGFQGAAGMRAAQTLSATFQGAGRQTGGEELRNLLALQGVGLGQPGVTLMEARRRLQDPRRAMQGFMASLGPMAQTVPTDVLAGMLEGQFPQLSPEQVTDLAAAIQSGGAEAFSMPVEQGAAGELLESRRAEAERAGVFAVPAREARMELARAAIGGSEKVRAAAQSIQNLELELAQDFLPSVAGFVRSATDYMRRAMETLLDPDVRRGESAQVLDVVGDVVDEVLAELPEPVAEVIRDVAQTPVGATVLGAVAPLLDPTIREAVRSTAAGRTRDELLEQLPPGRAEEIREQQSRAWQALPLEERQRIQQQLQQQLPSGYGMDINEMFRMMRELGIQLPAGTQMPPTFESEAGEPEALLMEGARLIHEGAQALARSRRPNDRDVVS